MAKLEIFTYPNPVIYKKCTPVADIDDEIVRIAKGMAEAMYRAKGLGLAAPQVGINKHIITLDVGEGLITLINPEITLVEGDIKSEEGCLCLPGITVDLKRRACARIKGYDLKGKELTFDAEDLLARAFQHEIDHLNGYLIIDRVSKLKRDLALRKYRKLCAKKEDDEEE